LRPTINGKALYRRIPIIHSSAAEKLIKAGVAEREDGILIIYEDKYRKYKLEQERCKNQYESSFKEADNE